ncbi:neopullulanase [Pseudoalteromonas ulvae UL12]|nr:neopullulanase [Pseudoalteromonas ulvae UL12]
MITFSNISQSKPMAPLKWFGWLCAAGMLQSCNMIDDNAPAKSPEVIDTVPSKQSKPVVYQMFTRLYGNKNTTNLAWGTQTQNGVGKFDDIDARALGAIKQLGVTHVWYTGVLHHDVIADYTEFGISLDDPDVVKGRAGSPYAIKDYYNVNPDLAINPANRLAEFETLIARTHQHGMKVVIDIVPNHVARNYQSVSKPDGISDFGEHDDTSVEYAKHNNFYYVVGEQFKVPKSLDGYQPLGGEPHPLADGQFAEFPAKWTGNGSRLAQPHFHDWYETVKVNYGVRPDGSYDFPRLPAELAEQDVRMHAEFWAKQQDLPDSWYKFRDIAYYWLDKGVDGFRYDMAEMVPVEFWSFLNSAIKMKNPDAFILAEVYNPKLYRPYIQLGKMDYLYDKVGFYDTLKGLMQGKQTSQALFDVFEDVADIESHMLHFLENHDEQRIASPEFAGNAQSGKPAMVVSALIGQAPTMVYFGQEVGEAGAETAGFGQPSRTSIFDYIAVPAHQRFMNNGAFDGGQSTESERQLLQFYRTLLPLSTQDVFASGVYLPINEMLNTPTNTSLETLVAFTRFSEETIALVVSNFSASQRATISMNEHNYLATIWQLPDGQYTLRDQLGSAPSTQYQLNIEQGHASLEMTLDPLQSVVLMLARTPIFSTQHNNKAQ